ncbi:Mu-like prophage major head subunit gpT family protein [Cypionkella psychrotolerans]|uniref:Mu-like prophage major head subunit gpT family protein n=1 Tax=Cypionkella psychrotolerans TaxID=1678131 RepID=UPI0006B463EB|nr:Mu-like prophage major head subunit gpT family protein [Cypionkella psychrotolerans]
MIINTAALNALRVTFQNDFQTGLTLAALMKNRVATIVPSSNAQNTYGWLANVPSMREWIGARVAQNIAEASYTLLNKAWELTIAVDRYDIEDDNLGVYAPLFSQMGMSTSANEEILTWAALKAGFTSKCYDGQNFFDTVHPVLDANGAVTNVANTDGGAGTPWFLMCTKQPVKPLLFQSRKAPEFVSRDKVTDDNVFDERMFKYGVDARYNVGYGFWQMAWGSKQTLNNANYATARAAIMGMKGDYGRPLGLVPDLLVVPPALESAGRQLLNSEYGTAGVTNEWKDTAELLVVPWLA